MIYLISIYFQPVCQHLHCNVIFIYDEQFHLDFSYPYLLKTAGMFSIPRKTSKKLTRTPPATGLKISMMRIVVMEKMSAIWTVGWRSRNQSSRPSECVEALCWFANT